MFRLIMMMSLFKLRTLDNWMTTVLLYMIIFGRHLMMQLILILVMLMIMPLLVKLVELLMHVGMDLLL